MVPVVKYKQIITAGIDSKYGWKTTHYHRNNENVKMQTNIAGWMNALIIHWLLAMKTESALYTG